MNPKFSAYGLFYTLGLAFWFLNMNLLDTTILCVFYSAFVGTAWGLIPKVSASEPLSWRHLLPPFMLVVLMMLAVRMKMVFASSEVVVVTAMALIHVRASILSFARLASRAKIFSWIQLGSFIFALLYLFQKPLLPISVPRNVFLMIMLLLSALSVGILLMVKKKVHESAC